MIGCRLRLHIDGYSECYDFWVNADSADIKPAGWCKENNHKLHPPKGEHRKLTAMQVNSLFQVTTSTCLSVCLSVGQSETEFHWDDYLQSSGSIAAPSTLFTCRSTVSPHLSVCLVSLSSVFSPNCLSTCLTGV